MTRIDTLRRIERRVAAAHLIGVFFLAALGLFFLIYSMPVNPIPMRDWALAGGAMAILGIPVALFGPRLHRLRPLLRQLDAGEVPDEKSIERYHRVIAVHPFEASSVGLTATLGIYVLGVAWARFAYAIPMDSVFIMLICGLVSGLMWGVGVYFISEHELRPLTGFVAATARRRRRVPLAAKIFISSMTLVSATLGLFGIAAYTRAAGIVEAEVGHRIHARTMELADLLQVWPVSEGEPPPELWTQTAAMQLASPTGFYLVIDSSGAVLATYSAGSRLHFKTLAAAGLQPGIVERILGEHDGQLIDRYYDTRMIAFVPIPDSAWKLVAVAPRSDFRAYLDQFVYSGLVAMGCAFMLALGVGYLITRAITIPIGAVTRAARSVVAERDLGQRVSFTTNDEVGTMAESFNRMAETIQSYAEGLEQLVAERTRELDARGKELQRKNSELETISREMRDFLHVVSHDLRAPLINVQGFASALQEDLREMGELLAKGELAPGQWQSMRSGVEEAINFIMRGVAKMDILVKGLLELARIESKPGTTAPIDTAKMVNDIIGSLGYQIRERAIDVEVRELPPVVGDPLRINQVFANLIDNAIKYMSSGGERRITIGCDSDDGMHRFYVQDTGPGIRAEDQDKVFRLFARVDDKTTVPGDGIGLAAVKKIIEKHGGQIGLSSEPGRGSTFWFTLPRSS